MISIKYLIGLLLWYKKPEPRKRALKVKGPKKPRYQALPQTLNIS